MNTITTRTDIRRWVSILFFAGIVAFGAVGLSGHTALAQQAANELRLSNSGLPISLVANPGTSVSTDIRIRNDGNVAETLKTGLMKFGAQGDSGQATLSDRQAGDDYFDWVTISPDQFVIQPNEYKTVHVAINVPKEAAFGYYYAVTFSRASDEKPAKGETVKGSLATLILLEANVPGAKRELQVEDFTSDQSLYQFLPATFRVKIRNTGNVHAIPHGDITVNQGNTELARMAINSAGGYILPQSNRVFTVQWNDGFPRHIPKLDNGKVVIDSKGLEESQFEVNWSNVSKFRIGTYSADLLMVYDDGTKDVPIERTLNFSVFPWLLVLVVVGVVGLIVFAIVTDIIKLEHFLFRGKSKKSKTSAARRAPAKKAVKATTRKKTSVTRKRK